MASLVTFSRATVASAIEIILIRRLPELLPSLSTKPLLVLAGLVLSVNYSIWLAWITLVYPFCLHPLRNFPAPKVCSPLFPAVSRAPTNLPDHHSLSPSHSSPTRKQIPTGPIGSGGCREHAKRRNHCPPRSMDKSAANEARPSR